jgi:hypothetical protein
LTTTSVHSCIFCVRVAPCVGQDGVFGVFTKTYKIEFAYENYFIAGRYDLEDPYLITMLERTILKVGQCISTGHAFVRLFLSHLQQDHNKVGVLSPWTVQVKGGALIKHEAGRLGKLQI